MNEAPPQRRGRTSFIPSLPARITVATFLIGLSNIEAYANATGVQSRFEEHRVEFHNHDVKLAGSLLLPRSEAPVPAVVFVHGAGRQTREPYREAAEYFANQGIAALIYDKRGNGESSGTYESHRPYENLVNDALAAIAFLKQRREIAPSQIGVWGLSQGTEIGAVAATRSEEVKFIIAVGASVTEPAAAMFYYRDNLFRKYGLSDKLRDVAEKAQLVQDSLPHNLSNGFGLSSFAPRSYPPPNEYVDAAWSQIRRPVLAMWGQLDQHVPVGESVAGLKNSLAHANNEKWTMLILPRAKHSLGISETGAIQEAWRGYPPGALKTMTDWIHRVINDPSQIDPMKEEGVAEVKGVLSKVVRYENLRWYGNGTVQAALWILFLISFLANTITGVRCGLTRFFRHQQGSPLPTSDRVVAFKRTIFALNFLILVAFSFSALRVFDQLHPSCPTVLLFLPLLGTVSTLATAALLIVLARAHRNHGWTGGREIQCSLNVLCLVLFVPFMFYWRLIGYHF
jgi:pimeloyl-ACP methyl ester carboxylesterase